MDETPDNAHPTGRRSSVERAGTDHRLPRASVIIPAHDVQHLIGECLDAIGPQLVDGHHELIVVDDASTDRTVDVIREWTDGHPEVPMCLLLAPRRGGPNASRNAGAAMATGALLAFTDGDDVVREDWLAAMVRASEQAQFLAGAVHYLETDLPVGYQFRVATIDYAQGNSMAVLRELVVTLGGFDPRIRRGGTEVEFAARLKEDLGITPTSVPDAIVRYRQPESRSGSLKRIFQRQRGHVLLSRLHPVSVPSDSPYRSVRAAARRTIDECWSLARGTAVDPARSRRNIVRFTSSVLWILRFEFAPTGPRPLFDAALEGYTVVLDRR